MFLKDSSLSPCNNKTLILDKFKNICDITPSPSSSSYFWLALIIANNSFPIVLLPESFSPHITVSPFIFTDADSIIPKFWIFSLI